MNCASFPSFRRSIGESLIEGNVHLNQHGLESWHLPQELVAKNKEEAFAYSSSLFVLDFRLYCDFSCILLGFLQVQDDEEEGFKEKRGVTLTSMCQSSWVTPDTHGHTGARHHLPLPHVWILCQTTVWSHQSLYAMPCPNKHYIPTPVTL